MVQEQALSGIVFRVLPIFSSLLTLAALLISVEQAPCTEADWTEALLHATAPGKSVIPRFAQDERLRYRYFKGSCMLVSFVLEVAVLFHVFYKPKDTAPPYLPMTHVMLQVLRFIFSLSDFVLVFHPLRDSEWVNPGLGMYGWGGAMGHFLERQMTFENWTHLSLAVVAAGSYATLSRIDMHEFQSFGGQLCVGTMMVLSVWYPFYDSKHWHACSRMGNAFGAVLVLYAPLVALSEVIKFRVQPEPPNKELEMQESDLSQNLDMLYMVLMWMSILMLLVQFGFTTSFCFEAPSEELSVSELGAFFGPRPRRFYEVGKIWKYSVVFLFGLLGSVAIFVCTEMNRRGNQEQDSEGSLPLNQSTEAK